MTKTARALMAAAALATSAGSAAAAGGELSEKSVRRLMDLAWSMTPQQHSKLDGTIIVVDKKNREPVMIPLNVASDVARVGRVSALAYVCNLPDDQIANYNSLMQREIRKKTWSDQQLLYISTLHVTTVQVMTGRLRITATDEKGNEEVLVDESKKPNPTCSEEERKRVKDQIVAYIKSGADGTQPTPAVAGQPAPAAQPGAAAAAAAAAEAQKNAEAQKK